MTRQRDIELSPHRARAAAAAQRGPALHRPHPDPQPRHLRRQPVPSRSRCRAAGGRAHLRRRNRRHQPPRQTHHPDSRVPGRLHDHAACSPTRSSPRCRLPASPPKHGYAFIEFVRRHGDFAHASAAVLMVPTRDGTIERCAITVGGVGSLPHAADARARPACRASRPKTPISPAPPKPAPSSTSSRMSTPAPLIAGNWRACITRRALRRAAERLTRQH